MRLEAGVVQRCSIDVIHAPHPGLLEDKEACDLHFVVVARLYQRESDAERSTNYKLQHTVNYDSTCI